MTSKMADRYKGKPLLRLLECYALKSIGHLTVQEEATLDALAPKLSQLYGHQGAWHKIIEALMELPPDMPQMIRDMWARNRRRAEQAGVQLDAQQFAELFVDQNLAS